MKILLKKSKLSLYDEKDILKIIEDFIIDKEYTYIEIIISFSDKENIFDNIDLYSKQVTAFVKKICRCAFKNIKKIKTKFIIQENDSIDNDSILIEICYYKQ